MKTTPREIAEEISELCDELVRGLIGLDEFTDRLKALNKQLELLNQSEPKVN